MMKKKLNQRDIKQDNTHHSMSESIKTSPNLLTCRSRMWLKRSVGLSQLFHTNPPPLPNTHRKPPCLPYTHLMFSDSVKQPVAHRLCHLGRPCEVQGLRRPEGTERHFMIINMIACLGFSETQETQRARGVELPSHVSTQILVLELQLDKLERE